MYVSIYTDVQVLSAVLDENGLYRYNLNICSVGATRLYLGCDDRDDEADILPSIAMKGKLLYI